MMSVSDNEGLYSNLEVVNPASDEYVVGATWFEKISI
jgi:hypothetical protein